MSENDETSPDLGAINTETGELPPEAPEAPILSSEEQLAEAPLFFQQGITDLRAKKADLAAEAANIELAKAQADVDQAVEAVLQKEKEIEATKLQVDRTSVDLIDAQATLAELKAAGASLADIAKQESLVTAYDEINLGFIDMQVAQEAEAQALADALKAAEEAATTAADELNAANAANAQAAAIAAQIQLSSSYDGKLEGAAGRKRLLAAQQCFLLYNNHFFVKKHKELLGGIIEYDPALPDPKPAYRLENDLNKSAGYYSGLDEATKVILVDDSGQTNDSTIVNRIKTKDRQEEFDKITPAEYAQLLPRLRLYKLNYDDKKAGQQEAIEFEFSNKIDVKDMSAVHKTFSSGSSVRGDGAGVKSFEWSYLGSDAFTATRDLKATLKLNFQSFNELQKPRLSGGKEYRYLDLVLQPLCAEKDGGTDKKGRPIYDPGCYEILAEVGYNSPSNSTLSPDMLEAVRNSVENIYLIMTDHSFEFEQDGTFSLTVNYRARLGSQLGSRKLNVLLPGGGNEGTAPQKKIDGLKKEIAETKKKEKEDGDSDTAPPEAPGLLDSLSGSEPSKTDSQVKQEELDQYAEEQRVKFYNAVYSSLRRRRWIHGTEFPQNDIPKYLNYDQKIIKPVAGTAGVEQFVGLPDPVDDNHAITYDHASAEKNWDRMYVTDTATAGATEIKTTTEATKAKQENQLQRLKAHYETTKSEPINFVYLGDIIAVVRDWVMAEDTYALTEYKAAGKKTAFSDGAEKAYGSINVSSANASAQLKRVRETFQIILGNINIRDFESKEARMVNMAHIPISLDAFLNFMTTKVVAKKRKVYTFSKFIDDLISDLVMQNLSTRCFGGLIASSVRTSVSMIELPSENGKDPIAGAKSTVWGTTKSPLLTDSKIRTYSVFQADKIGKPLFINKIPPLTKSGATIKKSFDYLLVNSFSSRPNLYGVFDRVDWIAKHPGDVLLDEIDDKTRGIPHYTFGQNAGILKTVKFQKTDQEYLPEAKYEQEGSSAINQLAAVYDVTFEMLGTSRFQPGQYIYFDPVTMGVGHPWQTESGSRERSYANLMGLGGYHLVIEVSCNIQRGEFVTTLKTRWTTSGCHPIDGCTDYGG